MAVRRGSEYKQKGKRDARRHREKQKDVVKKQIRKIVSESSIITRKKGKKVKIPIKEIVIPDFKPGKRNGEGDGGRSGIGQGKGKKGDVIGRRQVSGQEPGKPGNVPGEDYIESEVDIEEIIEMMLEDLGLPNLQKKEEAAKLEAITGYKVSGIRKTGPSVLLEKKHTSRQGIGRFYAYLESLKEESGQDELTCYTALAEADGNLGEALSLLDDGIEAKHDEVEPFPILSNQDLRYLNVDEEKSYHSNAVIFAMMDVSASMTTNKKYLARSMLFWINEFLKKIYENVEIRFIVHHARAWLVDEDSFFKTGESGGTRCAEAYKLARSMIESHYPTESWNVYLFHFSDGEDWDADATMNEAKKLIEEVKVNMLGYGEIRLDGRPFSSGLKRAFEKNLTVRSVEDNGLGLISGDISYPFLGVVIKDKDHILPAVQEFLKKERWTS
ncbi:MAG: DUF444 family protein [Bacteroidetes bacterium]|jgi:uncharacterized sporulation protein YeaH/YhbH (DUF444 family)|nr:DUF444 family protein [Bacteroidota bacterium]